MLMPLDAHAVCLPEAARLAGLDADTFAWLAVMMDDLPEDDRMTVILGADGPLFIASECRALQAMLGTATDGFRPEGRETQ